MTDAQGRQQPGTAGAAPQLSNAQRDWLLLLDAADHLYAAAALLEELAARASGVDR